MATVGVLIPGLRPLLIEPGTAEGASPRAIGNFLYQYGSTAAALIIASALCARYLERRTLASVLFKLHRGWLRDLGLGCALGALSIGSAVALELAAKTVALKARGFDTKHIVFGFVLLSIMFLIAAAVEEMVFRGFLFQALVHNIGPAGSVVITSALFGLAHLNNPDRTIFSTVNTMLAGVWLSAAYLKTRSLWFPTALHYSWNFAMAFFFGLPVSGITKWNELAPITGSGGLPAWISGGVYGPEGGIAASLAIVLSIAVIWKSGLFSVSEEMSEAIKHGRPEPRFQSILPDQTR